MKTKFKSDSLYWIWMTEILGAGGRYVSRLAEAFDSAFDVYNATEEELVRSGSVSDDVAHKLSDKSLKRAHQIIDYCSLNNIGILSYSSEHYPSSLKMLQNPPGVLYYKGTLLNFDEKLCIGVVGTRKMSEYGKKAAYKIAYELASAGAVVVSGMALGVDAVASCGALVAEGKTVAVLGCGIDVAYPSQHAKLKKIIEDRGLVITEFAPGTRPYGSNFPIRNRIISGLSQGTLIVEADETSGAMITAKCALMQGRGVFAVPGNIDESNSVGTNMLIKDGAVPVVTADDILSNYEMLYGKFLNYSALAFARSIYNYELSDEAFDKMGISTRVQGKNISPKNTSSQLRPTRKPQMREDEVLATTNKNTEKAKSPIVNTPRRVSDGSDAVLAELDESVKKVFNDFPIDRAITIDALLALGHSANEIMSAVTILEIRGLISSLPGNLYVRR